MIYLLGNAVRTSPTEEMLFFFHFAYPPQAGGAIGLESAAISLVNDTFGFHFETGKRSAGDEGYFGLELESLFDRGGDGFS